MAYPPFNRHFRFDFPISTGSKAPESLRAHRVPIFYLAWPTARCKKKAPQPHQGVKRDRGFWRARSRGAGADRQGTVSGQSEVIAGGVEHGAPKFQGSQDFRWKELLTWPAKARRRRGRPPKTKEAPRICANCGKPATTSRSFYNGPTFNLCDDTEKCGDEAMRAWQRNEKLESETVEETQTTAGGSFKVRCVVS
jgi:hypothetical protein